MEAEVLAPMVVEANTLPNHKTKVAMVAPAAAGAMAVAEGFNYCQVSEHLFLLLFSLNCNL